MLPHRDFLLVHPPMLSSFVAVLSIFTDNYHDIRVIYLFLNVVSGAVLALVVLQLARRFSLPQSPALDLMAVVATLLAFYSFHEMTHHDFRFLALRQFANSFYIFALYFLLKVEARGGNRNTLLFVCCMCIAGLTFPAAIMMNVPLLGVLLVTSSRRQQLVLLIGGAYLLVALLFIVYFVLVDNSYEQLVTAQAGRSRVDSSARVTMLLSYAKTDTVFFLLATASSLLLLFNVRLRWVSVAIIVSSVLHVIAPNSFYPHYTVAAAPGLVLAIGLVPFAIERFGRAINVVGGGIFYSALACHLVLSLPSLYREMRGNDHPDYAAVIHRLKSTPQPVLAFEPIYLVEAGVKAVSHFHEADMRFLRVKGVNLSAAQYARLEAAACTILLEPFFSEGFVPSNIQSAWRATYDNAFSNWWGTLLVTGHEHCAKLDAPN
jgi:hypothetical protein